MMITAYHQIFLSPQHILGVRTVHAYDLYVVFSYFKATRYARTSTMGHDYIQYILTTIFLHTHSTCSTWSTDCTDCTCSTYSSDCTDCTCSTYSTDCTDCTCSTYSTDCTDCTYSTYSTDCTCSTWSTDCTDCTVPLYLSCV